MSNNAGVINTALSVFAYKTFFRELLWAWPCMQNRTLTQQLSTLQTRCPSCCINNSIKPSSMMQWINTHHHAIYIFTLDNPVCPSCHQTMSNTLLKQE